MEYLIGLLLIIGGFTGGLLYSKTIFVRWKQRLKEQIDALSASGTGNKPTPDHTGLDQQPADLQEVIYKIKNAYISLEAKTEPIRSDTGSEDSANNYRKIIDNLHVVNELGQKVTSSLDLHQTFQHLYSTINSMMDAAVLELRVYDESDGSGMLFTNLGNKDDVSDGYVNHVAEWSRKNNREVFLSDAENDFDRYVYQPLVLPDGRTAKSLMVFPLLNGDQVTGTLCVISFRKKSFSDYHSEIISQLLGYVSVAIENAVRHEELNLTKIRAEQSEKFKEQFLANMSHEIRTPINAVTGMTRLLLEKQPREDQLRYLESIRNASDSLLVIINDILDLSKIEAGKVELERIDFSVRDVLQNVRDIMQFKAEEKGLMLSVQADDSIPKVLIGDPTRLSQILINLVGNAVKFTEKGSVTVNATSGGITDAAAGKKQALIHFSVSDTGIGMTPEQQSKLFMDYSQASAETSRKYGGTGLGLSISRQLVQLQGGTISVRSVAGEGSTFSFAIAYEESLSTSVSSQSTQVPAEKLGSLKGIRILLADDNEYNRIVARETLQLKLEAVHIDEAVDGLQAVELLRGNRYDIVLMDLVMPGMDGIEAARYIRTQMPAPASGIPILALTASVIRSEIEKCMEAGMNGFVPKPFKPHELLGAIYNTLTGVSGEGFREPAPSKPTAANPYSAIDLAYLNEFTEGDQERLDKFITLFLSKVPQTLETIEQAMTESDFDKVRIAAHSLKPQLRFTGVQQGLEMAEEIEQYCTGVVEKEQLRVMVSGLTGICKIAFSELELVKNGRAVS